jgi:hypothetical protein
VVSPSYSHSTSLIITCLAGATVLAWLLINHWRDLFSFLSQGTQDVAEHVVLRSTEMIRDNAINALNNPATRQQVLDLLQHAIYN